MRYLPVFALLLLANCGAFYITPSVQDNDSAQLDVQIQTLTPQAVEIANKSAYRPRQLPAAFTAVTIAGSGGLRGAGALPDPVFDPETRPATQTLRIPPKVATTPYKIGVGDVVRLTNQQTGAGSVLSDGAASAGAGGQSYTVPNSGKIKIPNVGWVRLAGLTLDQAIQKISHALEANQIDPSVNLEIAQFNAQHVSIGGAVKKPGVVPVTLTPLYLDGALAAAGGVAVSDDKYAVIRIYRDGTLYQIPLKDLYNNRALLRIRLMDGDSLFVDSTYDLDRAQAYFTQEINRVQLRQQARVAAINELNAEMSLRRNAQLDARAAFQERLTLGDVERDYVYVVGEVSKQTRIALPFGSKAKLADMLYTDGGVPTKTANLSQIYVLRSQKNGAVIAYHLDARNIVNMVLATRMEMRPNDIVFVSEQPITKWNRALTQVMPSLFASFLK